MKKQISYTRIISIVHGQSEYKICTHIKSNLRIKHEIISRDKGKSSIQISGLKDFLASFSFLKSPMRLAKEYGLEISKNKLVNLKIFIIMDVDDCTESEKKEFQDKTMFKGLWLYDYIIPIFNDPNLEKTMSKCGITVKNKKDYITIFPISNGDLDLEKAKDLQDKINKSKCSNMDEYIGYCIEIATQ